MRFAVPALIGSLVLCLGCASSHGLVQSPGQSSFRDEVYRNQTYGVKIEFRSPKDGWLLLTNPAKIAACRQPLAILCGANPEHDIRFFLTLEDGGIAMSAQDYQKALEHEILGSASIVNAKLQTLSAHAGKALVWRYETNLHDHVIVQAFYTRGTQNFRLGFIVPKGAYPQHRKAIVQIIKSVDLGRDSVAWTQ